MGQDWELPVARQALGVIAVLYMACAILRLARFNVENSPDPAAHKRFRGLPSPGAAGCIASLAILRGQLPDRLVQALPDIDPVVAHQVVDRLVEVIAPVGALLVALLM